jgi:sugar phosphate isomerase/epimerase
VEDTIEALVHFTDCDASFYATNAYCCDKPPLIEVACENMTIRMEDPSLTVYHSDGKVEYIPGETLAPIGKLCWGSSHRTCIRDFYDCIDSGAPFAQDWDGVKRSVTLMNSLYLSAREGHPVLLSTMPDCPLSCFADEIADSTDSQIALLKDLGISWVEFRSGDGKGIADYTVAEAEVIWEKLQRNGISVSALGSPIGKINITDDFEPHFETFKHVVKLAKAMHTRYIRMFSFYMPKDEDPGIYRDAVIERLKKLTAYAAEQDVVLLHENEKGIYGDNAPRCLELFKAIDSPHFRATFDFANFVQCGQDPTEAYQMLKPYITYVHIKDALAKDGTVVPGGQGDGHLAEIFADLKAEGYKGFFSLEPHLADFASLQSLEQEVTKRGRSDQEAAFCQAYEAFLGLICIK